MHWRFGRRAELKSAANNETTAPVDLSQAVAMCRAGRMDDALAVIRNHPRGMDDPAAQRIVATAYAAQGRMLEAVEAMRGSTATHARSANLEGFFLMASGQPKSAVAAFERAAQLDPTLAQAWLWVVGTVSGPGLLRRSSALQDAMASGRSWRSA